MKRFFCSPFFINWGILLCYFLLSLQNGYAVSFPFSPATEQTESVESQFSKIGKKVDALQKEVDTLKTQQKKQEKTSLKAEEGRPLGKFYMAVAIQFLHEKVWNLKVGIQALWQHTQRLMTWHMPLEDWLAWGVTCLKFLAALSIGFLINILTYRSLKAPLKFFVRWSRRIWSRYETIQHIIEAMGDLILRLVPLLTGAIVQVGSFYFLENTPFLRNAMFSLVTGLFIWGGVWHFQKFLLAQSKRTFLFSYLSTEAQRSLSFKIQVLLFCVIVSGWVGEFTSFIGLPESAQKILMIGFGLGVVIAFFGITQALKKPILKTLQAHNFHAFTFLAFLWTSIWNSFALLFYGLFILDENLLATFFWPIIITLLLLPLIPLLYRGARRFRLLYLWRTRHRNRATLLYRILRSHNHMNRLSKILAYGSVGFSIIEIWEFHLLRWLRHIIGDKIYNQIFDILLLFVIAWTVLSLGDRLLLYYLERSSVSDNTIEGAYLKGRVRTLLKVARILLRIVVWVSFLLFVLSNFYDITSLITSLSIVSAALAFGVQSLVKDFVTGFFILLDNSLVVGDQVEIDGKSGTVEDLSLRTLKIRADNGTLQTIPFGSITVIGNKSRYFAYTLINFSASYDENPDKVTALLEKAYQQVKRTPSCSKKILAPIEIRGMSEINDYAMVFQARLKTAPGQQDFIKRAYNKVLKQLCDEAGLRVPSPPYPIERDTRKPSLTNTI